MTLTLAARYRNAKDERKPFILMAPALQCMALLNEYRELRLVAATTDDDWRVSQAESSMEQIEREFASAREEMRRGFRRNASIAQLERLADNPMQVA